MIVRRILDFAARKSLYLWVKSDSIVADTLRENWTKNNIVYVLENRSWSNLLVLEHECHQLKLPLPLDNLKEETFSSWRSVYTVAPRIPFKAWLKKQPKRSPMLRGLLQGFKSSPEQEIIFVPVSIFWGRPVAKQKGWLRILFAESWDLAGRVRKVITIILHGRHVLLKLNQAIDFRDLIDLQLSDDENIDNIQNAFSKRLTEARTATLGPDISHRRTLVRKLLQSPNVKQEILKRSIESNISEYRAALKARRYVYEIVANCTSITIKLLQIGLTYFWNKFYSGIEVNNIGIPKNLSHTHELIYVPCHRSHIDYLLLSYVIHSHGLAIPYIAAGKNLNMPIIGAILRSAGAFFIRRSFKGNTLYSSIMFEYIALLISLGMPIKYFIEGGRSRTGRLLAPKPGMLSMTIRGFLKYRSKPVAFIPVYIGYEKMIEGKAYIAEMAGKKKQKENLISSIKSILNIRGEFGKVTTNFGNPVYLEKMLTTSNPRWNDWEFDDAQRPAWLKNTVNLIAQQVSTEINLCASVTPTNLVSIVLIANANQSMDQKEMADQLELSVALIKSSLYADSISITPLSGLDQIKHVESLRMIQRQSHSLGDILSINNKTAGLLNYYRNNILHLFILPSFVACCFLNRNSHKRDKIIKLATLAYPALKNEFYLPWTIDQIDNVINHTLQQMLELKLLHFQEKSDSFKKPNTGTVEFYQLEQLANVTLPLLELYYIILTLLIKNTQTKMNQNDLEELCYLNSQRLSLLYQKHTHDFFDKKLIENFIDSLINMEYVTENEGFLQYNNTLSAVDKDLRLLVSSQIRTAMLHTLKMKNKRQ